MKEYRVLSPSMFSSEDVYGNTVLSKANGYIVQEMPRYPQMNLPEEYMTGRNVQL